MVYCAAISTISASFARQKRSETTAAEHRQYMRLFDGWLVRSGFGSYVEVELNAQGALVAVRARRSVETGEIKIIKPEMLIGWMLEMASGSENTPKGTHAAEIAARAGQEAATACGKRFQMQRTKGAYGYAAYSDEPWSLQA